MKLPTNLSGLEVIQVLTKYYGWGIHRRKGSHVTLKKTGSLEILTVPVHDRLDQGTLLSIIRKAGIEKEDFISKL